MPKLHETLPLHAQWTLAVQTKTPHRLAENFAGFVGQFYDRPAFDELARQVSDLYQVHDATEACRFRSSLDRRLSDRYHPPVVWNVDPVRRDRAA